MINEQKIQEILAVKDSTTIQKFLRNIKPFRKISPDNNIPLEMLEKLVSQYCNRYDAGIQYIKADYRKEGIWVVKADWNYSVELFRCYPYRRLSTLYAESLYELYAKISIAFYLYSQNGIISRKTSHPEYGV